MRLLFTTFTFPPQANGVAEVVAAQTRELAARGHEVTVATSADEARTDGDAGAVRVVPFRLTGGAGDAAEEVRRYRRFIAEFPADAILCHCWRSWPTDLAVEALPRNPAKAILVSHGYSAHRWERYPRPPWGLGAWLRGLAYVARTPRALRSFDHAVFLSERRDGDRFLDHRFVHWRGRPSSSVIPNGTYPGRFAAADGAGFRARHGLGAGPLVLCVATFAPSKNQELALRAFLRADCADATLLLIGNTFNSYSDRLRASGAPRVRWLAGLPRAEISAAYAAADLVVLSSRAESQPLVLLDAMAAGRAFVSTDVGCVSELPGGVVVRDEREMAEALRELLRQPERRAALGTAGRAACEQIYSWPRVADRYEELLARLVSTPR